LKQEKTTKILEMILLIISIILIIVISFFGILRKNLNSWENIIPNYEFGKELSKMRVLTFSIDTSTKEVEEKSEETSDETSADVDKTVSKDDENSKDEDKSKETEKTEEAEKKEVPVNPEENLTKDNYEKSKSIIEKRLAKAEITDSEIVVNKETGDINIYVPFNDFANKVSDYVTKQGKIEIIDTETKKVLIPQNMISSVSGYSTISSSDNEEEQTTSSNNETKYDFGLQLKFTNEGVNKLAEVTKTYIDVLDEEGKSNPKTVDLQIDGETAYTTYFDPDGTYTELNIPIYSGISKEQYDTYRENVDVKETNINTGLMPIVYVANETTYLENDFNKNVIIIGIIVFAIINIILGIVLIVKYKGKGFLAFIAQVRIYSSIFTINKNSKRNSYYIWYDFSRCTCINKLHVYSKIII